MKPQTRFSAATMALVITGIAPAFGEVTQPTTIQTSTTTAASTTTTASTSTNVATGTGATATTPLATTTMNKGQTDIATSLAKAQLTQYGITQPTPQQLNAALNGGTITVGTGTGAKTVKLQGVLTQRAAGQGWGQIANGMGVKLGTVVSGTKSSQHDAHELEEQEHAKHITTANGGEAHHAHKEKKHITQAGGEEKHHAKSSSHKHIITAAGTGGGVYSGGQDKHHGSTVTTAGGKVESGRPEHGKRYGAGIVTASGGSYVASNHSPSHGAGIVTASSAGSSGAGQGHSDEGSKHSKSGK